MRMLRLRHPLAIAVLAGMPLTGCRSGAKPAGSSLPVAQQDSRALPGSTDAADAPDAPVTATDRQGVTTFHDPETGITLDYPAAWRPLPSNSPLAVPVFSQSAGPARWRQALVLQGTPWARTNLEGLSFSWTTKPGVAEPACSGYARNALRGGTASQETVGGVQYTRVTGSDAGMCHQLSSAIDATVHGGTCFLFERDVETLCPDIKKPGEDVVLTPAQLNDLHAQLNAVMASVRLP